jgi:hypothetical protein
MGDDAWKSCVFALETDNDETSRGLFSEVISFVRGGVGSGGALTPRQKGRYALLTREDLMVIAKERGLKSPAQALKFFMQQERVEGEMKKKTAAMRKEAPAELEGSGGDEKKEPEASTLSAPEDDEDDPDAMEKLAKKEAAEEEKRLMQQNFDSAVAALDEVAEAPDRIYILSNYPSNVGEVEEMVMIGESFLHVAESHCPYFRSTQL